MVLKCRRGGTWPSSTCCRRLPSVWDMSSHPYLPLISAELTFFNLFSHSHTHLLTTSPAVNESDSQEDIRDEFEGLPGFGWWEKRSILFGPELSQHEQRANRCGVGLLFSRSCLSANLCGSLNFERLSPSVFFLTAELIIRIHTHTHTPRERYFVRTFITHQFLGKTSDGRNVFLQTNVFQTYLQIILINTKQFCMGRWLSGWRLCCASMRT